MPNGRGNGFSFSNDGFRFFVGAEELAELMRVQQAKNQLRKILLSLDGHLLRHSKSGVIGEVNLLLVAVNSFQDIILAEAYAEVSDLIVGLRAALLATDGQLKNGYMAKIEAWHASKPKFILHLAELRQIVFAQ